MFEDYNDLLYVVDIQSALCIGRTTAYRLLREGKIKHLRIGRTIRIPKRYLIDFVLSSCYHGCVTENSPLEGGK